MIQKLFLSFCLVLSSVLVSCGGDDLSFDVTVPTQLAPYINRIDPATGAAGDIITIFGFGFSSVANSNVVSFGSISTFASSYTLLDDPIEGEVESITVTIPSGISVGDVSMFVTVFDNTSNSNLSFNISE